MGSGPSLSVHIQEGRTTRSASFVTCAAVQAIRMDEPICANRQIVTKLFNMMTIANSVHVDLCNSVPHDWA